MKQQDMKQKLSNSNHSPMRLIYFTIVFLMVFSTAIGQIDQRQEVVDRIQQLATRYRDTGFVSFDIKYLYATQASPTKFIDSVEGSFKLNHSQFWYKLDNTEAISNDSEIVTVFNEDKLIYVGNPVTVQSANPLSMLDSVLLNNQYSRCAIAKAKGQDKISIDFNPGYPYKKIEYLIDNKTGFVISMTAIIKSDQLNDPEAKVMFDKSDEYGVLQVNFSNYKTTGSSGKDFSSEKYLKRNGKSVQPTIDYSNYQIINSKPNN
jgi:hypothetical protein